MSKIVTKIINYWLSHLAKTFITEGLCHYVTIAKSICVSIAMTTDAERRSLVYNGDPVPED